MRMLTLKVAAAMVAVSIPFTATQAAESAKAAYDQDLSCAAYHLEIAGFYKSELGKNNPRSDELLEQYRASGTAKIASAMEHAPELGKDLAAVQTELLSLLENRIKGNLETGAKAELIMAHVKDTTLKADTCQRTGN